MGRAQRARLRAGRAGLLTPGDVRDWAATHPNPEFRGAFDSCTSEEILEVVNLARQRWQDTLDLYLDGVCRDAALIIAQRQGT